MSKQGRNEQAGSKNSQFNGGWYSIGRAKKKEALKRDGFKCRKCGKIGRGSGMHVHHLIPERGFDTPQEAHELSNLVTLCSRCHLSIEWDMIKELYRRALQLESVMNGLPGFVPLSEFIMSLLESESKDGSEIHLLPNLENGQC